MKWISMLSGRGFLFALVAATVLTVGTACSSPAARAQYTVKVASKAGLGNYLVDSRGMTLYCFNKDTAGKSNATAAIIQNWPVFSTDNIIIPSTLKAGDFSTIMRDDGVKQATYKGWPLYYFIKDQSPGDTLGQGVNGVWFILNPDTIQPAPPAK